MTEAARPTVIVSEPGNRYFENAAISGDYAFLADGSDGLTVVDISTPSAAHAVVTWPTPWYVLDVAVYGHHVLLATDDGMLVLFRGREYFGAEAVHLLALLTSPSDTLNRVTAWAFASERRSRLIYPWLRAGRRALLFLLRRSPIQPEYKA